MVFLFQYSVLFLCFLSICACISSSSSSSSSSSTSFSSSLYSFLSNVFPSSAFHPVPVPVPAPGPASSLRQSSSTTGLSFLSDSSVSVSEYYVWFVGASGAGKTSTISLLTDGKVKGRGGFKHDTINITDYTLLVKEDDKQTGKEHFAHIHLMDTRGYGDMSYTLQNYFEDIGKYPTYTYSKLVVVLKQDRIDSESVDLLRHVSSLSDGKFPILITKCDGDAVNQLTSVLRDISLAHGPIMAYNHVLEDTREPAKLALTHLILKAPFFEMRALERKSLTAMFFAQIDKIVDKVMPKLVKAFVGGSDIVAGVCVLVITAVLRSFKT